MSKTKRNSDNYETIKHTKSHDKKTTIRKQHNMGSNLGLSAPIPMDYPIHASIHVAHTH